MKEHPSLDMEIAFGSLDGSCLHVKLSDVGSSCTCARAHRGLQNIIANTIIFLQYGDEMQKTGGVPLIVLLCFFFLSFNQNKCVKR